MEMRSEDGFTVWGSGEPGEAEADAVGPVDSTESVPCAELLGRLGDSRRGSRSFCGARADLGGYGKNRSESVVG